MKRPAGITRSAAQRDAEGDAAGGAGAGPAAGLGNQRLQSSFAAAPGAGMEVGRADDPEERAADRLAASAMAGPCACGGQGCGSCGGAPKVRRQAEGGAGPSAAVAAGFGGRAGRPLDLGSRRHFERRFGTDFGAVRLHDDVHAHRVARGIGARAFAIGSDIGFAAGRHRPETAVGQALLAHELAHVALGHGGTRRQLEGEAGKPFGEEPRREGERRIMAPPVEAPKEDTPFWPSAPIFFHDGVVIADDREFMRGVIRRLVADRGWDGAMSWSQDLDEGVVDRALAYIKSNWIDAPRFETYPEAERRREEEKARKLVAAKAIATARAVSTEVLLDGMMFRWHFETTAVAITQSVLASSEAKVRAEMLRYGLQVTETMECLHGSCDTEVVQSMDDELPGQGLAGAAKDLLAKRAELHQLQVRDSNLYEAKLCHDEYCTYEDYLPTANEAEHKRLEAEIKGKKHELSLLEGVYQDRYPIIAAISRNDSALRQVATGPSAKTAGALNNLLFKTLADIETVRSELGEDGDIEIWTLPDIVTLAKAATGCNDQTSLGWMRNKLVDDKVTQVKDDNRWRDILLNALALGLAILAAIPTGGGSLAVGVAAVAGMGSFAVGVFQAKEHLDQYLLEKAMAGTDLDRARAIGTSDPSLIWLALDIAGALMDLGPALKGARAMLSAGRGAFRSISGAARTYLTAAPDAAAAALEQLRKVAREAEDTLAREAGSVAKSGSLADRVVRSAEAFGKPGASIEKTLASAAGHEAEAVTLGAAKLKAAAAAPLGKAPARLGDHMVSVTPSGLVVRCSDPCVILRAEFAAELGRDSTLAARLETAESKAVQAARMDELGDKVGAQALADEAAREAAVIADRVAAIRRTGDIRAYRGVDLARVDDVLLMDERLVVEMPFKGQGAYDVNAGGWLRSEKYYWTEMLAKRPDAFSPANIARITGKKFETPVNDPEFWRVFKQFDSPNFRGQRFRHHHIGGGGQAAAVPQSLHVGFGGIHNVEKAAGYWGFEDEVADMLQRLLETTVP